MSRSCKLECQEDRLVTRHGLLFHYLEGEGVLGSLLAETHMLHYLRMDGSLQGG